MAGCVLTSDGAPVRTGFGPLDKSGLCLGTGMVVWNLSANGQQVKLEMAWRNCGEDTERKRW
jgi:hypothetical protein